MAVADPELDRLNELAGRISQWQQWILGAASADTVDGAILDRSQTTIQRVADLNDDLHEEDFEPKALANLRDLIIKLIGAVNDFDGSNGYDVLDKALITLEGMRHIVRDALDWHVSGSDADAREVVAELYASLPNVKRREIANLAGISPRHLQRLAREGGPPPQRLKLVARLAKVLSRGWTEEGVVAWFMRSRDELGGRRPIDLLDEQNEEAGRRLLVIAKQGRAQHGG